jgi:hypothetical protein
MSNADRGFMQEWKRREFLTAVGAGIMAGQMSKRGAHARAGTVKIRFEGVILVVPNPATKTAHIRMPLAEGSSIPEWHADTTPATPHSAYLATFAQYSAGEKPVGNPIHLLGKNLRIKGRGDLGSAGLKGMAPFKKFTKNSNALQFSTLTHSCQIILEGGELSSLVDRGIMGTWSFSKSLNGQAPRDVDLAHALMWDSEEEEIDVVEYFEDGTTKVVCHLKADDDTHPANVIAHYSHPPKDWTTKHGDIVKGVVDHDFKWLYQIVRPNSGTWEEKLANNGFPEKLLPAPRSTKPPIRQVGSPTCFGGCYGCT